MFLINTIIQSAEILGLDTNELNGDNITAFGYQIGEYEIALVDILYKDGKYYWIIRLKKENDIQYYQMELGTDNLIELCS